MTTRMFSIQNKTLFSESLIWQINKDFYRQNGISAWSDGIVPHNITNSALASITYAELIYAFLKDLEHHEQTGEVVYILELGAGHGRLCFNILEHLDELISFDEDFSTKYCYVLSDIVEENLSFFSDHPRLKAYYDRGVLDLSYFDATESRDLVLRKSKRTISNLDLEQPILAIANYFLDSIPNELLYIKNKDVFECSVSIDSAIDPKGRNADDLIRMMELTYHTTLAKSPLFENVMFNEILDQYAQADDESFVLFPKIALECMTNISSLSNRGLVLLTMDKGFKELQDLVGRPMPDIVKHGSFSLWVNFHAISEYCIKNGGHSMFDTSTNMSIELGCLFFTKHPYVFHHFEEVYRKHSNLINLDDFNGIKNLVYKNLPTANLSELLGFLRLTSYDSNIFINLLPRLKQLSKEISVKQRSRLKQTLNHVWTKHYAIKDDYDLAYEMGGLMYDLGYYDEALAYFNHSADSFGNKVDVYYNQILCYYQLRQDVLFYKTLEEAELRFPGNDALSGLEKLDMR